MVNSGSKFGLEEFWGERRGFLPGGNKLADDSSGKLRRAESCEMFLFTIIIGEVSSVGNG